MTFKSSLDVRLAKMIFCRNIDLTKFSESYQVVIVYGDLQRPSSGDVCCLCFDTINSKHLGHKRLGYLRKATEVMERGHSSSVCLVNHGIFCCAHKLLGLENELHRLFCPLSPVRISETEDG